MPTDFFEIDEQRRAKRKADGLVKYYSTIHAIAAGAILSEKDADEFVAVCELIGKPKEIQKSDVAAVQRAAGLANHAADLPDANKALAAAEKIFRETDAKNLVKINKLRDEVIALMNDRNAKTKLRDAARQAGGDLEELRRERWELFGLENPVEVAKRCHIAQEVFGSPTNTANGVIGFEEAMMGQSRPWAGKKVLPLENQSKFGDLAYLDEAAVQMVAQHKQGRYLLPISMKSQVKIESVVYFYDDVLPFGQTFRIDRYLWLRPPGWTQAQVDANVARLEERLAKDYRRVNTDLNRRQHFAEAPPSPGDMSYLQRQMKA